jgi:hypothetical protein
MKRLADLGIWAYNKNVDRDPIIMSHRLNNWNSHGISLRLQLPGQMKIQLESEAPL